MIATLLVACTLLTGLRPSLPAAPPARSEDPQPWSTEELRAVTDAILLDVERIRGQKFVRPIEVEITDQDGFQSLMLEHVAAEYPEGYFEGASLAARMLGLVPPELDYFEATMELLRSQVGGFYIPGSDTFYLMSAFSGGAAKVILAHELTHALDDQLHDLDGNLEARLDHSDAALAYQALVEGSGMVVMTQWSVQHLAEGEISMQDMLDQSQLAMDSLEQAPRFLWLPLFSAYMCGTSFLANTDSIMKGQMDAIGLEVDVIERAFADPPVSSEQILHPSKYWGPGERDLPRTIAFDATDLPEGWSVLYEDTLGELHLGILTLPPEERGGLRIDDPMAMLAISYTSERSAGWGGDRLILLGNGDRRFLRLVSRWDSLRDAGEFYGALSMLLPQLEAQLAAVAASDCARSRARHRDVELAYGDAADEVVLTLQFGARDSELRALTAALTHREVDGN